MADHTNAKSLKEYNEAIMPRLQELCEPLKILGISNFAYAKFTKDQRFFRIGTHEKYTELFFKYDLYNRVDAYRGLLHADSFSEEKKTLVFLWDYKSLEKMRMSVNMWNGITFYQFTKDLLETWAFGGSLEDIGLSSFYLNNLDLLKKFFLYFKSSAKDIIDVSDKNKTINILFHDKNQKTYKENPEKILAFNQKMLIKRYCIFTGQKEFSLSMREIDCLFYKSQGQTAKQIARNCQISPRTVESYLNNVRIKSGSENINQLIYYCKEEGIF